MHSIAAAVAATAVAILTKKRKLKEQAFATASDKELRLLTDIESKISIHGNIDLKITLFLLLDLGIVGGLLKDGQGLLIGWQAGIICICAALSSIGGVYGVYTRLTGFERRTWRQTLALASTDEATRCRFLARRSAYLDAITFRKSTAANFSLIFLTPALVLFEFATGLVLW